VSGREEEENECVIEGGRKIGKTVEDAVQFGERVFVDVSLGFKGRFAIL